MEETASFFYKVLEINVNSDQEIKGTIQFENEVTEIDGVRVSATTDDSNLRQLFINAFEIASTKLIRYPQLALDFMSSSAVAPENRFVDLKPYTSNRKPIKLNNDTLSVTVQDFDYSSPYSLYIRFRVKTNNPSYR